MQALFMQQSDAYSPVSMMTFVASPRFIKWHLSFEGFTFFYFLMLHCSKLILFSQNHLPHTTIFQSVDFFIFVIIFLNYHMSCKMYVVHSRRMHGCPSKQSRHTFDLIPYVFTSSIPYLWSQLTCPEPRCKHSKL